MDSRKVGKYEIYFENRQEFQGLVREIFLNHNYYIELESDAPRIIDLGAHIGLSVLYFKKLFPNAEILAVEPNPYVLPLLSTNIEMNRVEDVEIIGRAVSGDGAMMKLYIDASRDRWNSTAGIYDGAWDGSQKSKPIMVESVRLSSLLDKPVDLLKMDIEGSEVEVLSEAVDKLGKVENILVEYHPRGGERKIDRLVELLEGAGFEVETESEKNRLQLVKAVRV